jgi:branched-chain amino acid aminotransferase
VKRAARAPRHGPIVALNSRLVPAARARISALDRGFLYGDGLFETLRTYAGEPFALERHLARLARSARAFRIPFDSAAERWRREIRRVLAANTLERVDAAVRLTVSRGAGPIGIRPAAGLQPTTLLFATPLDARLARAQARGVAACFFPFRLATATLPSHKTLHYLPAVLGKMIADRKRAWEALYLGSDDTVLEGTTSTVFTVRAGALRTPPLGGILPGVTRALVAALARRLGISLDEAPIPRAELFSADEVFLTASTIEVLPVVRVDRMPIGSGRPGPVARALHDRYRAYVTRTLARRANR